jgi:hypothetical protein
MAESIEAEEEAEARAEEAAEAVEEANEALADNEAVATEGNSRMEFLAELIESGEATDEDKEEFESLKGQHDEVVGNNEEIQGEVSDAVGEQAAAIADLDNVHQTSTDEIATNQEIIDEKIEAGKDAESKANTLGTIVGAAQLVSSAATLYSGIRAAKNYGVYAASLGTNGAALAKGIALTAGAVVAGAAGSGYGAAKQEQTNFANTAKNEQDMGNFAKANGQLASSTVDTMRSDTSALGANTEGLEYEEPQIEDAPEAPQEGEKPEDENDKGSVSTSDEDKKTEGSGNKNPKRKAEGSNGGKKS